MHKADFAVYVRSFCYFGGEHSPPLIASMLRPFRSLFLLALTGCAFAMPAITSTTPPPPPSDLPTLAAAAEAELLGNILPFWQKHAPATGVFAFQGEVGNDLKPNPQAVRGMLLSARILWTFSAAHRMYPDKGYLAVADAAYKDLEQRFWDVKQGGYFWAANPDGSIYNSTKQSYGQSFALYGLAEYHLASQRPEPLQRAIQLFHLMEKYAHDARYGGYLEVFTADWKRPAGAKMSVVGPEFPKSQNTHLHLMEAFSELYRAWPEPLLRTRLREVTELMITRVPTNDGRHLQLYFDADWSPRSDHLSFGHDIEANWLLCDAADALADPEFTKRVHKAALLLAHATLEEGMDKDGGLWNEAGPKGLTNSGKDWWAQAEAAVGFVNAYQLSNDKAQLEAALRVWDFTEKRIIDRKGGEWSIRVEPDGGTNATEPKISMWKCPYHNARACMELVRRAQPQQSK